MPISPIRLGDRPATAEQHGAARAAAPAYWMLSAQRRAVGEEERVELAALGRAGQVAGSADVEARVGSLLRVAARRPRGGRRLIRNALRCRVTMRPFGVGTGRGSRSSWSSSTPSAASRRRAQRGELRVRLATRLPRMSTRMSELHDAVVEHDHPVGEHDRLVDVVGDQQHRRLVRARTACAAARACGSGSARRGRRTARRPAAAAGSRTSERASAARCCSPPDSSCGQAFSRPASPTSASACRPRSAASPAAQAERRRCPGPASRAAAGSPGRPPRPARARRSGRVPATSRSRPASARSSVLLPLPLRPISATNSPACDVEVEAVQDAARLVEAAVQVADLDRAGRRSALERASPCQRLPLRSRRTAPSASRPRAA